MNAKNFDFKELVSRQLNALETNAFAVEQAYGLPPDAIRNVLRSKKSDGPSLSRALEIVEALGLSFQIGPKPAPTPLAPIHIDAGEFLAIPERAAQLAAGGGAVNGDDQVIGHLIFRKDWLKQHSIQADKATLVHVTGNSMAPCILDGDLVLIDTSVTEVPVLPPKRGKPIAIYAFHQDGTDRVKRLARPTADLLLIISDNPEFPPEVISGPRLKALNIIGRVRWFGHTIGI
jgi:phage repressor protein C with HTH and peptisase S24 domain